LAELLVIGGAPQQALSHVQFVLERQPENPIALALLGSIEIQAGNTKSATQLLEHSLKNDPTRESVAVDLANLYNQSDRVKEARNILLESAKTNPTSPMSSLALGRLEEQEGDGKAAENAYRAAVAASDSELPNRRLAQFLERLGRVKEAEQVLQHLETLPTSAPTALADFQLSAGKSDAAVQLYEKKLFSARLAAETGREHAYTPSRDAALVSRLIEAELQADAGKSVNSANRAASARALLDQHRSALDEASIAVLEAEIALASGDLSTAERQAKVALTRAPDSAAAHYVHGLVFRRQDKVAEAKEEWNTALGLDADNIPSRLALANQTLSEHDAATADEQVSAVIRSEPANIAGLDLYARVLLAEGKFAAARGILARSLALDGRAAESHIILGELAMAQRQYGSALIDYQQALLIQPESAEALYGLLSVYRTGTITRPVLRQMEKVANAPPSSASLMEITGRLYDEHGWHADALRVLKRAVEIDSHRPTAVLALSNAYAAQGDNASASQTFLASGAVSSSTPVAALLAAEQSQQQGDEAGAIRSYELALQRGESSGAAANNLAWIYAQRGTDLQRALKLAQAAVERNPSDASMLDTLGVVYLKLHDYSAASETLKRAVALAESKKSSSSSASSVRKAEPLLYQHLAAAYSGAGMNAEAEAALAKAR
jgi:tetratricopeptide (TPR) repeat protein